MRRIICGLLLGLALLTCTAYAEGWTWYELDALDLRLSVPDRYETLTRDIREDDPALNALGLTRGEVLSYMEENEFYLMGYDMAREQELVVRAIDSGVRHMGQLSDNEVRIMEHQFEESAAKQGAQVLQWNLVDLGDTQWTKALVKRRDGVYTLQYVTIHDYRQVYVALHSYTSPIAAEEKQMMRDLVDGTRFSVFGKPWRLAAILALIGVLVLLYWYGVHRRPMDVLWAFLLAGWYCLAGLGATVLLFRSLSLGSVCTVLLFSAALWGLLVRGRPAPQRVPEPVRTARYCDRCGTPLVPGARFCGHCGAEISEMIPPVL